MHFIQVNAAGGKKEQWNKQNKNGSAWNEYARKWCAGTESLQAWENVQVCHRSHLAFTDTWLKERFEQIFA